MPGTRRVTDEQPDDVVDRSRDRPEARIGQQNERSVREPTDRVEVGTSKLDVEAIDPAPHRQQLGEGLVPGSAEAARSRFSLSSMATSAADSPSETDRCGCKAGELNARAFSHTHSEARRQTPDHGAPVSLYPVSREMGTARRRCLSGSTVTSRRSDPGRQPPHFGLRSTSGS